MSKASMNEHPLMSESEGIPLFYPYVPEAGKKSVSETLSTRWIGQGPKVDIFEKKLKEKFAPEQEVVAVGSGTDALHLAYLLAGIQKDDEVIVPVFTCTATNIPLMYIGAKIKFIDVDRNTLNINVDDIEEKITKKTKAIVCVDYGGYPCDYRKLRQICDKYNLKLISDAAHSIGTKYGDVYSISYADFTIFSFQAIKTITTGDGGCLFIKDKSLLNKAKRLRWFGIDREAKQGGVWENDIKDIGFKYQMNDIAASLGIAGLDEFDKIAAHRKKLFEIYKEQLSKNSNIKIIPNINIQDDFVPWLITIITDDRVNLMNYLRDNKIESAQVHYRNDRYSIFSEEKINFKNMDELEDKYLVLPLYYALKEELVEHICKKINEFFN